MSTLWVAFQPIVSWSDRQVFVPLERNADGVYESNPADG